MIGTLRHRITFLQMVQGRDPLTGAELNTIKESNAVWAKVDFQEVGSDERMEADQLTPMTSAHITLRYRQGITTEMEVKYDGMKYKILSVLEDSHRGYLTLEVVQVGAYREQALTDDDGQTLTDASGALLFGAGTDGANYTPPRLTFTDGDGAEFTPE